MHKEDNNLLAQEDRHLLAQEHHNVLAQENDHILTLEHNNNFLAQENKYDLAGPGDLTHVEICSWPIQNSSKCKHKTQTTQVFFS